MSDATDRPDDATPPGPVPEPAPSPDRALIDLIEAGLTEGDDMLIEYIDGRAHEGLSDGRRIPL